MEIRVLRFESLPSTNIEVARLAAEGAPEGLCVVADEQTAGRGRLDRQWISPKGAGLYFSILLRPRFDQSKWPMLTLMTSVAVQAAIFNLYQLETDIKWPNDVLFEERKLCGILAEVIETEIGRAVVLGIGINLKDDAFPRELESSATSIERALQREVSPDALIQPLVEELTDRYQTLGYEDGAAQIVKEWSLKSSYASGRQVTVVNGSEVIAGTTRGLAADGALLVETTTGEIKSIRTGDVTRVRSTNSHQT
jgi:BirA family transcriptional regulator, biotin operon repressor / biotin---[acetyl-CoA-carboxylase] ligase